VFFVNPKFCPDSHTKKITILGRGRKNFSEPFFEKKSLFFKNNLKNVFFLSIQCVSAKAVHLWRLGAMDSTISGASFFFGKKTSQPKLLFNYTELSPPTFSYQGGCKTQLCSSRGPIMTTRSRGTVSIAELRCVVAPTGAGPRQRAWPPLAYFLSPPSLVRRNPTFIHFVSRLFLFELDAARRGCVEVGTKMVRWQKVDADGHVPHQLCA